MDSEAGILNIRLSLFPSLFFLLLFLILPTHQGTAAATVVASEDAKKATDSRFEDCFVCVVCLCFVITHKLF